jgi:hypothetical protein
MAWPMTPLACNISPTANSLLTLNRPIRKENLGSFFT